MRDEPLKIFNGHPARRAAARHARQIGGVQAEFIHARLEPRRKIARARRVRRHGQTAHGGLNAILAAVRVRRVNVIGVAGFRRRGNVQAGQHDFLLGGFNLAEHRADGVAFVQLRGDFCNAPAARRRHVHVGLVRLDFDQILAGLDGVAGLDEKVDDAGLGDGLAQLRHDDGNGGHV
jgi:hypothetical protein